MPRSFSSASLLEQAPGSALRAKALARRADRFPQFIGLRGNSGERLDGLVVLIAGIGSVGATIALSLARLQVKELRLVDRGVFKPESLLTQPVDPDGLGRAKASHIAGLCRQFSPTRVVAHDCPLQELPLREMLGADLVIVAGDNLTIARDAGQRCLHLSLPLLAVGVHGDSLTVQCRFHDTTRPGGACPACLFTAAEFRLLEEERVWSCEGAAGPVHAGTSAAGPAPRPTRSVRSLCGLAGEMGALLATRWALRLGPALPDTMTELCGYTWQTFVTPLRRRASCPCRHERWRVRELARPLAQCRARELLEADGPGRVPRGGAATLALRDYRWVELGRCRCPEPRAVGRFVRVGQPAATRCPRCRGPVYPQPFHAHERVTLLQLGDAASRSLQELGAGDLTDAIVQTGARTTLLVHSLSANRP